MGRQGNLQMLRITRTVAATVLMVSAASWSAAQEKTEEKDTKRPSLALRASPNVSFAPASITLSVDVKGGPNDYEEFYCAGVEWEWGDGTSSESSMDCEPYEPGKSEIKRRYTIQHTFQGAGNYRVVFKLKRKDKVLAATNIQVAV